MIYKNYQIWWEKLVTLENSLEDLRRNFSIRLLWSFFAIKTSSTWMDGHIFWVKELYLFLEIKCPRFASFSKICPLTIPHLLTFIPRTNFRMSSESRDFSNTIFFVFSWGVNHSVRALRLQLKIISCVFLVPDIPTLTKRTPYRP